MGLIPQTLPFTKSNNAIRTFRHALSLDEHRVKFIPSLHQTLDPETAKHYDFVAPRPPPPTMKKTRPNTLKKTNRISNSLRKSARGVGDMLLRQSEEVKTVFENAIGMHSEDQLSPDSEREHLEQLYYDRSKPTDTLEVWFAGCHCGACKHVRFAYPSFTDEMYQIHQTWAAARSTTGRLTVWRASRSGG